MSLHDPKVRTCLRLASGSRDTIHVYRALPADGDGLTEGEVKDITGYPESTTRRLLGHLLKLECATTEGKRPRRFRRLPLTVESVDGHLLRLGVTAKAEARRELRERQRQNNPFRRVDPADAR